MTPITLSVLDEIAEELGKAGKRLGLGLRITEIEMQSYEYDALISLMRQAATNFYLNENSVGYRKHVGDGSITFVSPYGAIKIKRAVS